MTGTPQTMPEDFCELCEEGNKKLLAEARLKAIDECLEVIKNQDNSDSITEMSLCLLYQEIAKLKEKGK